MPVSQAEGNQHLAHAPAAAVVCSWHMPLFVTRSFSPT